MYIMIKIEKSRNKLLEEYSKAIDYLTINEENRLRKKVEMLTIRADKMQQPEDAVEKLKSQYLEYKFRSRSKSNSNSKSTALMAS
jgi:hypothetical protein